jgi:trigger factor
MQVDETKNEGLSREYSVTLTAKEIGERVDARLSEVGGTVRVPGFRPGKVPMSVLRQRYSKAVMGEVLEKAVTETSQEVLDERELRPAVQPKIEITSFEEGQDLVYTINVDLMPEITPMDFSKLELTRLKATASDAEVDDALNRLAKDFRNSEPLKKARAAKEGDLVVIDFVGKIDGEAFDGGSAEGHRLELGSNTFIPGFEEQLVGAKKGDEVEVKVAFPENYGAENLAGKDAVFEVKVNEIEEYVDTVIDDAFATNMGLESLDQLKGHLRERIEADYGNVARGRLKRDLLDKLHEGHDFEVPEGMVETEFEQIWTQYERAKTAGETDPEDEGKSEDEIKEEYRNIAKRRVMLGMLLSEVGRVNEIAVGQDEVNRAIVQEAQKYPGQEQQVLEFYQNNPQANASLRAPLMEDKVIDFIIEMAQVTDKEVSAEDLMKDPDEDGAPAKKAASKKAGAKKSSAKKSAAKKAGAKKAAAKKDAD